MPHPARSPTRLWFRRVGRVATGASLLLLLVVGVAVVDGWRALGKRASGERRLRMERSSQWDAGDAKFENPQPLSNDLWGSVTGALDASDHGSPSAALVPVTAPAGRFATPPTN